MALLAELVDTSQRVGENAGRRTKIARMAELLRRLAPEEIDIGVSYLAGGIASVASTALTEGAAGLSRYTIALFQPLAPMLAQPANDIADAMARIPMAALEWKLDGARVQVHKSGDSVRIYSRTGNDVT